MPEYRFGSFGQPVCTRRWENLRLPVPEYDPESTTVPWQDGQRFGAITYTLFASVALIGRQAPSIFASQLSRADIVIPARCHAGASDASL